MPSPSNTSSSVSPWRLSWARRRRGRKVGVPFVLALLTPLGAAIGAIMLAEAPAGVLATVLAFGAVAFMYLVTEELLVRAHERGESAIGSALFFVGFLLYLVIEEIV